MSATAKSVSFDEEEIIRRELEFFELPPSSRATFLHAMCSKPSVKRRLCGAVDVDLAANEDFPIFKKYGVMNSGLVDSTRYNQTIFDSLATVKVCPTHGLSSFCGSWLK